METVLITGGTGLVGRSLTKKLLDKGYRVIYLSRREDLNADIPRYGWDYKRGLLNEKALEQADHIINLAGAGVAEKRWTKARKAELYDSRIRTTRMLFEKLESDNHGIKSFVSASAIGIYKSDLDEEINEDGPRGEDFLAAITKDWECEMFNIEVLDIRTFVLRIGIVLSEEGGAFKQFVAPMKWGLGASLGSGKQFMSWIHIDDLVEMFIHGLNSKEEGTFNAVASDSITNKDFTKSLAMAMKKPLWAPNVPAFTLKLALGEMGEIVTRGQRISNEKIKSQGFKFKFDNIELALQNLVERM